MSETKFTKGEWFADIRGGCCAVYEKSREDDTPGCHHDDERNIHYSNAGANYNGHHWAMSEETEANAHLIAAAPEMYEMLKSISESNCRTIDVAEEIETLLAKARGEK